MKTQHQCLFVFQLQVDEIDFAIGYQTVNVNDKRFVDFTTYITFANFFWWTRPGPLKGYDSIIG